MDSAQSLTWQSVLLRFGAVLVLILINAFFVLAEFALVSARQTSLRQRAKEGDRRARLADHLKHRLDEVVAATQLGITVASLLVGWIGEQTLAAVVQDFFHWLPPTLAVIATHSTAATIAFIFISAMHVIIGELMPKSIGIRYPNRSALFVSRPMWICMLLFKPFVWALNGAGTFGLRLFGFAPAKGHQMVHSVDELKLLIEASHEGGALDKAEKDLLHKVFKFGDLVTRQVMVPRTEMIGIPVDATVQSVVEIASKSGHTRFPVYENQIDNIVGILHMKDIVIQAQSNTPFQLNRVMKEAHFVPEQMPIVQLLTFFKQKHTQMVIIVDEFGGTSGLATLEDVIEEIIGDFYDEHHPVVRDIVQINDREVLVAARVRIEDVNERLHLHLESDATDTIGGYVLEGLGSIPRVGDVMETDGALIRVEEMSHRKIKTLRLILQPQPVQPES
jgi:magnesium and cobalt exporter, CNNM family